YVSRPISSFLPGDIIALPAPCCGGKRDLQIQRQRPQAKVALIPTRQFLRVAHVDAIDLRKSADSRLECEDATPRPLLDQQGLHRKARPWTDQADLVAKDVPDLRKLVDFCLAQEMPQTRHRTCRHFIGRGLNRAKLHRSEFVAGKLLAVLAYACLCEDPWAGRLQANENPDRKQQPPQQHRHSNGESKINETL